MFTFLLLDVHPLFSPMSLVILFFSCAGLMPSSPKIYFASLGFKPALTQTLLAARWNICFTLSGVFGSAATLSHTSAIASLNDDSSAAADFLGSPCLQDSRLLALLQNVRCDLELLSAPCMLELDHNSSACLSRSRPSTLKPAIVSQLSGFYSSSA